MLWNKDFLFLHIPKTAGKSLSHFFVQSWERPIYGLISQGQVKELEGLNQDGLNLRVGRGHENMIQAEGILATASIDIKSLKAIFLCIRNPYDMMVSNYFFMRKTYQHNPDKPNFKLAASTDFEGFCAGATAAPMERWMTLQGKRPDNLHIVRFEHLKDDLLDIAKKYGFAEAKLTHLNASEHEPFTSYITPQAEKSVYKLYKYLFDEGFYERIKL